MSKVYLLSYSVSGIKSLDQVVTLSFYKKNITKPFASKQYNIKAIYGENGSGKSAIIASVDILKNILMDPGYLNNPFVQSNLLELINKRSKCLYISARFLCINAGYVRVFQYEIMLKLGTSGRYEIASEELFYIKNTSSAEKPVPVFSVNTGEFKFITTGEEDKEDYEQLLRRLTNLLSYSTFSALLFDKESDFLISKDSQLTYSIICLILFAAELHVYMDKEDTHMTFLTQRYMGGVDELLNVNRSLFQKDKFFEGFSKVGADHIGTLNVLNNAVPKTNYSGFQKMVSGLYEFLHIFKHDLNDIEIEKKEDGDLYYCSLIMVYGTYKVFADFESTGVKKLIRLYSYIKEMTNGGIVFIDEFDSNLHDVYLCALLEYLMEYANGQLCFTTHNVGPMDVLKHNKKSIDFLSADKCIYEWKKNGNYSPSKLYKKGMIEGSPFNVDSIDFIKVFGTGEED